MLFSPVWETDPGRFIERPGFIFAGRQNGSVGFHFLGNCKDQNHSITAAVHFTEFQIELGLPS